MLGELRFVFFFLSGDSKRKKCMHVLISVVPPERKGGERERELLLGATLVARIGPHVVGTLHVSSCFCTIITFRLLRYRRKGHLGASSIRLLRASGLRDIICLSVCLLWGGPGVVVRHGGLGVATWGLSRSSLRVLRGCLLLLLLWKLLRGELLLWRKLLGWEKLLWRQLHLLLRELQLWGDLVLKSFLVLRSCVALWEREWPEALLLGQEILLNLVHLLLQLLASDHHMPGLLCGPLHGLVPLRLWLIRLGHVLLCLPRLSRLEFSKTGLLGVSLLRVIVMWLSLVRAVARDARVGQQSTLVLLWWDLLRHLLWWHLLGVLVPMEVLRASNFVL